MTVDDAQLDFTATEEPSDASLERLSAALDRSLSPPAPGAARGPTIGPNRQGTHSCLRCGHHWTPHLSNPDPRCCPLCNSAYWNKPPKTARARRPEDTDWDAERERLTVLYQEQSRRRSVARIAKVARSLGLAVVDLGTGKKLGKRELKKASLAHAPVPADIKRRVAEAEARIRNFVVTSTPPAAPAAPAAVPANAHVALDADWLRQRAYGRTVPPPPGLEEGELK
jgi:hypothetical protein